MNTGGDCGSASHGAIDFHAWWCLRKQACPFTVKVPDGGHTERMFTCDDVCTSDGLTCMSQQADQAELCLRQQADMSVLGKRNVKKRNAKKRGKV